MGANTFELKCRQQQAAAYSALYVKVRKVQYYIYILHGAAVWWCVIYEHIGPMYLHKLLLFQQIVLRQSLKKRTVFHSLCQGCSFLKKNTIHNICSMLNTTLWKSVSFLKIQFYYKRTTCIHRLTEGYLQSYIYHTASSPQVNIGWGKREKRSVFIQHCSFSMYVYNMCVLFSDGTSNKPEPHSVCQSS